MDTIDPGPMSDVYEAEFTTPEITGIELVWHTPGIAAIANKLSAMGTATISRIIPAIAREVPRR